MLYIWTNCAHFFPILLDMERMRRQECEWAIAAWRRDFVQWIANEPKSLIITAKNRPWIVKATLRSIFCGSLLFWRIHSTICLIESTESTGFRTNKCYAILLEFLGDLCLKVGFCLLVIPFRSVINVISTRNPALVYTSL